MGAIGLIHPLTIHCSQSLPRDVTNNAIRTCPTTGHGGRYRVNVKIRNYAQQRRVRQ